MGRLVMARAAKGPAAIGWVGTGRARMSRVGTGQAKIGRLGTGRSGTGRLRKKLQRTLLFLTGFNISLKGSSINDSESRMLFLGENRYDLISYMIYFGCTIWEYMRLKINSIMQMRFRFSVKVQNSFYTNLRNYISCF
jgi:hypothetical protein